MTTFTQFVRTDFAVAGGNPSRTEFRRLLHELSMHVQAHSLMVHNDLVVDFIGIDHIPIEYVVDYGEPEAIFSLECVLTYVCQHGLWDALAMRGSLYSLPVEEVAHYCLQLVRFKRFEILEDLRSWQKFNAYIADRMGDMYDDISVLDIVSKHRLSDSPLHEAGVITPALVLSMMRFCDTYHESNDVVTDYLKISGHLRRMLALS